MNETLFKFITICCKTNLRKKDKTYIYEFLYEYKDIKLLTKYALKNGVLPTIYKTIKTLDNIPPQLLQNLKQQNLRIAQKNILMSAELIKIIKLLEDNNISTIALKGPTLSMLAYNDITLRQYGDLDILVQSDYVYKAASIISNNNYIPDNSLEFFKNKTLLKVSSDLGLRNIKNNTYIELHWKLFRKKLSMLSDTMHIYNNYTTVHIQNYPIKTLNTELLLVYLCAHGSKHMWERISWILDIDRIISNTENLNWDKVIYNAKQMKALNMLLLGLHLSSKFFDTKIPNTISNLIIDKQSIILPLEQYTIEILQNKQYSMKDKFNYHSKLYDSKLDSLKYYIFTLIQPTPDDILFINLPNYLSFLYFIIRPFRLVKKYLS